MNQIKSDVILAAIADAAASDPFQVDPGRPVTVIMHAALGIEAGKYGDLQISHDGVAWQDVFVGGNQVRMSSVNNRIQVVETGLYRIEREAMANPTAITIKY